MMYLYIFEDFFMKQYDKKPNEDDLNSIDSGVLTILKFKNGIFQDLQADGSWKPFETESRER